MDLSKTYIPQEHEARLYEWWEAQGYFKPETLIEKGLAAPEGERFCITMPPPNVTGILHLGHGITAAVEDLMTRYYRMRGFETLYLPGSDHAGIATQNVVERELAKEGITRHDLGREAFIERAWEWKEKMHQRITDQHRKLGISCDWERERFTLDDQLSHAVRVAFDTLYKRDLIYRGPYMVNWCPRCESAVSDLEVIPQEHDSHLWVIRYPIRTAEWDGPQHIWGSGRWAEGATTFIEMATTRPETILGDSGVAVHPEDPRWGALVGQTALLPAVERVIPIVADEAVQPEFGTGAVKVTPAHDPTDYEIGMRHNLAQIDVMTETALMNEAAGPYAGMERYACRKAIVADFEREGLLVRIEDYHHAVGHCQRCDTIIEPRISTQWFVRAKPLAEKAIQVVRDGTMEIIPDRFEKTWFHWMENIRDWCISRQLWWGHRIPVWYCDDCDAVWSAIDDPTTCPKCGSTYIRQDEDVLDTWFSSGLWPFSTLGWPDADAPDLRRFFPTDMRETGYDIIFFWVARETMLSLELMGRAPYRWVYLHGLIRDQHGAKISKSMPDAWKYDPLYIIEEFGTDALRYTLTTSSSAGNDMNLDPRRIEGARNFANKLWQAGRFILMNLDDADLSGLSNLTGLDLLLEDRWILSRLHRLIGDVFGLMEAHQYGEAGRRVRDFLWDEFCDWYIEATKVRLYDDAADKAAPRAVLLTVLEQSLRLLHPFMPFVTEALWQALPAAAKDGAEALIIAPWPMDVAGIPVELFESETEIDVEEYTQSITEDSGGVFAMSHVDDPRKVTLMEWRASEFLWDKIMNLITGIRNARAEYNVEAGKRVAATVVAGEAVAALAARQPVLAFLARLDAEQLAIVAASEPLEKAASVVVGDVVAYLPLAGLVDVDAECARLQKALGQLQARITASEGRLAGPFAEKAPEAIVQRERDTLAAMHVEAEQLREQIARLQG